MLFEFKVVNNSNQIPTGQEWRDIHTVSLNKGVYLNKEGKIARVSNDRVFKVVAIKERKKGLSEIALKSLFGGLLCVTIFPFFSDSFKNYFFAKKENIIFGCTSETADSILRKIIQNNLNSPGNSSFRLDSDAVITFSTSSIENSQN